MSMTVCKYDDDRFDAIRALSMALAIPSEGKRGAGAGRAVKVHSGVRHPKARYPKVSHPMTW